MKIGLIGCGRIAADHVTVYQNMKNIKVIGVSDINLDKARFFADKFGIDKVFTNHENLLEIKDLDFVDVCTPPSTHASIVCDAAKFGHNVLLEKPMALSTLECERMIHEVDKHDVSLCICHNQIFFPAMRQAKERADSGYYDIVSFRTSVRENPSLYSVPAWNTSQKEKGIIWEVGCHPAYLQLHFLENISGVYAVGRKVKYPVFDEFSVLFQTSGQAYGIMEVSWLSKETEKIYEINSSDGKRAFMIASPPWANEGYDVLYEKTGITQSNLFSDLKKITRRFVRTTTPFGYHIGHFCLMSSFIKSLRDGSPPPVPPEKGKKTVELLECIEESLDTHKVVTIGAT